MKIYIDLLPEQRKQEIKRNRTFRTILREEFLFLLPILLFICILLNVYYVLVMQKKSSIATYFLQQSQEKYQELDTYKEEFKKINETGQILGKIQSGHLRWKNVFVELSNITPEGIYTTNLSTKDYSLFLSGKAKTRENLLDFKNKLETSSCFQKINVPLSNLVVKNDIDFQIDLAINEDCLK